MQYDNNPFSKYLSDKKMFDWSYHMTAKQHDEYSLQRYKELFFFFVSLDLAVSMVSLLVRF